MSSTRDANNAYKNGRISRQSGESKDSCPIWKSNLELRHWWLAGWHDRDIEIEIIGKSDYEQNTRNIHKSV